MGIFGTGLLSNDNALDIIDLVKSSNDTLGVFQAALDALFAFYDRKARGLAPRFETEAERDEGILCFEKGALENNPHVPREFLVRMVDEYKAFVRASDPIEVDNGEEEISKACASAFMISATISGDAPKKLKFMVKKLLPQKPLLPVHHALGAVKLILSESELPLIFGPEYKRNVQALELELEKLCETSGFKRAGPNCAFNPIAE